MEKFLKNLSFWDKLSLATVLVAWIATAVAKFGEVFGGGTAFAQIAEFMLYISTSASTLFAGNVFAKYKQISDENAAKEIAQNSAEISQVETRTVNLAENMPVESAERSTGETAQNISVNVAKIPTIPNPQTGTNIDGIKTKAETTK